MAATHYDKSVSGLVGAITPTQAAAGGMVEFLGFSYRETAASTAVIRIREGSVSGKILETLALTANQCVGDFYPQGIVCNGDVYVQIVSGTVEGGVRVA